MRCYRIMSEAYYRSPYSASGSAARWNPKGTRMIYASSAPSVALLEYLCIKGNVVVTASWYMNVYTIADKTLVGTLEPVGLPHDWNSLPYSKATQEFGKAWLEEREYPFLRVPSARMDIRFYPAECNLLINPDFPGVADILRFEESVPFNYLLNQG